MHLPGQRPLDVVNERFHRSYDAARGAAIDAGPVLVVRAGALALVQGSGRTERAFEPEIYHALKSAAHAPVALYAILHGHGDRPPNPATTRAVAGLVRQMEEALERLDRDVPDVAMAGDVRALFEATLAFARRDAADSAALDAFAAATGPALLGLTDHATHAVLDALHAATDELLGGLAADDISTLRVVVAGVHQARNRSVAMQYFRRRLHEPAGSEDRVTFAEGVTTERDALALVGTQRLDRAIACAFFGDADRLQRDVLGDAAERRLAEMDVG